MREEIANVARVEIPQMHSVALSTDFRVQVLLPERYHEKGFEDFDVKHSEGPFNYINTSSKTDVYQSRRTQSFELGCSRS